MMNVDQRILMDAIETRTRQEMRQRDRENYPDDYFDDGYENDVPPLQPPVSRVSLKPDELALHQQLLEIARAHAPAPAETFFG